MAALPASEMALNLAMLEHNFTSYVNWTGPSFELWNYTCEALTPVLSYAFQDTEDGNGYWFTIPMGVGINFTNSILPSGWPAPTDLEAIAWFYQMPYDYYSDNVTFNAVFDALSNTAVEMCSVEMCNELKWDGDGDLSGIGIMISYYMVAILATIYYIVLAPGVCEALGRPFPWNGHLYSKVVAGFEESLQGFLDAMLLFAISMTIAAITRYVHVIQHPDDTVNFYQMLDCVYLSTFSVFPAFVLQSLSHEVRRRRIRLGLWFLVMVFAITLDVLYNKKYLDLFKTGLVSLTTDGGQVGQLFWVSLCQSPALFDRLELSLRAGHAIMCINCSWWVYYVVASLGGSRLRPAFQARKRFWKIWETLRLVMRLGNGLMCLTIMWVFLAFFTIYRSDVSERAGNSDSDDEWSFGQVLGLVTWVPVLIDLVVVYVYGASEGHEGHMSHRYKVVAKSDADLLRDRVNYEQASMDEKFPTAQETFVGYHGEQPHVYHQGTWLDA